MAFVRKSLRGIVERSLVLSDLPGITPSPPDISGERRGTRNQRAPQRREGSPTAVSGVAVAALVVGILGLFLGWLSVFGTLGFGVALLIPALLGAAFPVSAIVLGLVGMQQVDRSDGRIGGRGMAVAGLVLGVVQVVLMGLAFLFLITFFSQL